MEEDEAGRLRAFREKFGRGWDSEGADAEEEAALANGKKEVAMEDQEESLMDLISGYNAGDGTRPVPEEGRGGKKGNE